MKMKSLVELMRGRNLLSNTMKVYTTRSIIYNPLYVSSRTYRNVTEKPRCLTSLKLTTKPPTSPQFPAKSEQLWEDHKVIKKLDIINLHDLLFTKYRDYVIRHKDNMDVKVKAAQLAGKVVVLYFLPLHHDYVYSRMSVSYLIDTYTYLLPDNNFEVVLVAYGTAEDLRYNQSNFESIFYHMPWTAIPFPDITSREHLVRRFGIDRPKCYGTSVVVDSCGMVLQSDSCKLFKKYGGLGYPFSDERIEFLKARDDAIAKKPSLKALLGSPKRDYVISNKGDKVHIDTLEEKVVALYLYEEGVTPKWLTANIKTAYEKLVQNKSSFEVVLIYLYGTSGTIDDTSEQTFQKTFDIMPWLALPFRDPRCERLMDVFKYPHNRGALQNPPTLIIIGPHGQFIETQGADILCKFRLPAYPFTRERVAQLDTEKVRGLTLDMLWDRNTIFRGKDGSKVRFAELVGKRIVVFFEGNEGNENVIDKKRQEDTKIILMILKERYLKMKGTSDEFEVIYITNSKREYPYDKHIKDAPPWFVSLASELLPIDLSVYCCYCHLLSVPSASAFRHGCWCGEFGEWRRRSSMLFFDRDGQVVRKSLLLLLEEDMDFPFSADGLEKEAFHELHYFCSSW